MGKETKIQVTAQVRKAIFEQFIVENQPMIRSIAKRMLEYREIKMGELDEKNQALLNKTLGTNEKSITKLESKAEKIAFTLATVDDNWLPIQNIGGMIVPFLRYDDSLEASVVAFIVAMELLQGLGQVKWKYSKNGHIMVASKVVNKDLQMKNIYLPLIAPDNEVGKLGTFNWELEKDTRAYEAALRLNNVPCMLVPLTEPTYAVPDPKDFSPWAITQREYIKKQQMRKQFLNDYNGTPIYFKYNFDYRGRMYSEGYYANPQGNEMEKSMIQLAHGKKLDFYGKMQLMKSIASAYGLDKTSNAKKLRWFYRNEKVLHLRKKDAKEPYVFEVLLKAWKQYKAGEPVNIMIELDATNSQTQIYSIVTRNKEAAIASNVMGTNEDKIHDLYDMLAQEMTKLRDKYIESGDLPFDTPDGEITRNMVKYPFMKKGYGQQEKQGRKELNIDLGDQAFPEAYEIFLKAMENLLPGLNDLQEEINKLWRGKEMSFTLPDGFKVTLKSERSSMFTVDVWDEKVKVKVHGTDPKKYTLILFVGIIHAVDGYIAREIINRADFDILTIHDAFRVHPNDAHKLIQITKEVYADILDMDLLSDILSQLTGTKITVFHGDLKREDILSDNTKYILS